MWWQRKESKTKNRSNTSGNGKKQIISPIFLVPKAEIKSFLLLDETEKGIYVSRLTANLDNTILFICCLSVTLTMTEFRAS